MNPLEQRVQELERQVQTLTRGGDLQMMEQFMRYFVIDAPDTTDADVTLTVTDTVGADGGTVSLDVLDFPDKWFRIRHNGEVYRLAAYLERLDSTR